MFNFLHISFDNITWPEVSFIALLVVIIILLPKLVTGSSAYLINMGSFLQKRKEQKLDLLSKALDSKHSTEELQEQLQEELSREYFKLIYGIDVNKDFRNAIVKACKSSANLHFHHFKSAISSSFLGFEDEKFVINITSFDKLYYSLNFVMYFITMVYTVVILISLSSGLYDNIFSSLFWVILLFVFAIMSINQIFPYRATRKIEKEVGSRNIK